MLNKRGTTFFYFLMLGVVCIVLALALTPAVKDVITSSTVMGVDGMNCDSTEISNQDKAICTSLDFFIPLTLFVLMGLAGLLLTGGLT